MTPNPMRGAPRRLRGWEVSLGGAGVVVVIRGSYSRFMSALRDWDEANLGA